MEKLSLKIQLSYVIYGILFYTIAVIYHNQYQPTATDLNSGLREAIGAALFFFTTNLLFLLSLIFSSFVGIIYSKLKNKEALKPFAFIFIGSSLLLLGIILLDYL